MTVTTPPRRVRNPVPDAGSPARTEGTDGGRRATWQPVPPQRARRRPPQRARRRPPQRFRPAAAVGLALAVFALLGIAGIVAIASLVMQESDHTPVAVPSQPVYAEPSPGADPVQQAQEVAVDDVPAEPPAPAHGQPLRLVIPVVGIDAVVGSMRVPDDRRVNPPTPGAAYWLRDYSALGDDAPGTGYIAGHTYRGSGGAVFNPLFDPETREARIHAGDAIEVTTPEGVTRYLVTAVQNYDKKAVVDETELWQDVPGRLVLVACWYNGADPATANLVVYAQRDAA